MIVEALRKKGLIVHEEVHGISREGSCRRIDMLAIPPGSTSAYIIDPIVRFEAQEQQPADVHAQKCRIYEPTVPFYLEKYHLTSIEVVGLMVVVITEDIQNVHLLLEYRPHIDVSLTCEHDPKLQEYCVCPQNMPQFDSEGIPNQAPESNKPMILNGPTSKNREGSDQVQRSARIMSRSKSGVKRPQLIRMP
ncbi:hypothetical protein ANN_13673 [Periplaneta americana]|uniref:Uncharacterized protein n=1 Tax=Periplaneta americana TaxID=6978 RepID=A0ABQ8TM27_PERAM|nr:hypothetical protein ANN_13673 [Periplaneta americana]